MFFENWASLFRVLIIGVAGYIALVFFLRISGKRTLSRMDPFDFVITTALGSALAQMTLSRDSALVTGIMAFAVIIGLQTLVIKISCHSETVQNLIKPTPALLFYRGQFLHNVMKRESVPEIEILAAIRKHGNAALENVEAVILESDSAFSVILNSEIKSESALTNVHTKT